MEIKEIKHKLIVFVGKGIELPLENKTNWDKHKSQQFCALEKQCWGGGFEREHSLAEGSE